MNYRNRALLDLAYELDCTLRIPGVCEGGTGEPAHANWAIWGKGGAQKAHDFAFCAACRKCHVALDQGRKLNGYEREFYWLRGHVETMRQLWERGLIEVGLPKPPEFPFRPVYKPERRRKSRTARPDKVTPRGARIV